MDVNYLHFIQLFLFIMIFFLGYRLAFPTVRRRYVAALLLMQRDRYSRYRHFRRCILREDNFAFEKYQIWRYIEKRKYSISSRL